MYILQTLKSEGEAEGLRPSPRRVMFPPKNNIVILKLTWFQLEIISSIEIHTVYFTVKYVNVCMCIPRYFTLQA
jgi:hypothetical protein